MFTREKLSDEIRTKLAEELSNTALTVELGGPTESAKLIDWMWFHTMPADSWAVGGRFDDTYVKGRKMVNVKNNLAIAGERVIKWLRAYKIPFELAK